MAGERSAFVEAPDVEDVNPSLNQKRVDNERLPAGRDVNHTNTCSNFTLSENTCSDSVLSEDDVSKLTVDGSFNCKKLNVNVLTEV